MMSDIKWRWLCVTLSVFAVALMLHAGPLVRHFQGDSEKVGLLISGPRTDLGDNYYYFSMLRHVTERISRTAIRYDDPDGGDHRNINAVTNAYAGALYTGYSLYKVATFFTRDARQAVLLTSIIHTALLVFCFVNFLMVLIDDKVQGRWFLPLVLAFIGMVFVDAFGYSVYLGRPYWAGNLLTYSSNPTRLINPTLFWSAGLATTAFIVRWLRDERTADFIGATVLAGCTGLFSISVGATLFLALGFFIVFEMIVGRIIRWRLVVIALSVFSGLAWNYLQMRAYMSTPLGQELRHGEFIGLYIKWQFLLLLGLIPFVWRMLGKERVFIVALVISTMFIGMFCESFHLGDRLWLRGAVIYAWAVFVFVSVCIAQNWLSSRIALTPSRLLLASGAMVLMAFLVFQVQQSNPGSWKGFVERDKWEMLDWMNAHLLKGSVVASADIEDSFLLPIYTQAKPLYSMYGLTNGSRDDELRRYFYDMRLFGRDREMLLSILRLRQEDDLQYLQYVKEGVPVPYKGDVADATMFLELVVYYSYVHDLANVLIDPVQHQHLEKLLNDRAREALQLRYSFDYAVLESSRAVPPRFSEWPVIYKNRHYFVLRNPITPYNYDLYSSEPTHHSSF